MRIDNDLQYLFSYVLMDMETNTDTSYTNMTRVVKYKYRTNTN